MFKIIKMSQCSNKLKLLMLVYSNLIFKFLVPEVTKKEK